MTMTHLPKSISTIPSWRRLILMLIIQCRQLQLKMKTSPLLNLEAHFVILRFIFVLMNQLIGMLASFPFFVMLEF
jgi:hypothetical protein